MFHGKGGGVLGTLGVRTLTIIDYWSRGPKATFFMPLSFLRIKRAQKGKGMPMLYKSKVSHLANTHILSFMTHTLFARFLIDISYLLKYAQKGRGHKR